MTTLEIKSLVDRMAALGLPEHTELEWRDGCVYKWWYRVNNERAFALTKQDAEAILAAHYWRHIQKESPNVIPIGGPAGAVQYMEAQR